jgi:hypothetical protein
MHPHALCIGQRIAQLKERDVGVLRDQFFKEGLMRSQLSLAARRSLRGRFRMALGPHLTRPPRPSRAKASAATPPRARLTLLQCIF